jgi:hypothetical protein
MLDTHANSIGFAVLDWNNPLQTDRGPSRSIGVTFHVPDLRHGRCGQTSRAGRNVRQDNERSHERAPNYLVVLSWVGFLLFIGAGGWVVGMVLHNEALAKQQTSHPASIYYCSTGVDMPMYEPCKDMKYQRDI